VKPLAVTGAGVVSALGIGRLAFAEAVHSGRRAPRASATGEALDPARYPRLRVMEVVGFDASKYLGDKGLRSLDRLTKLLVVAARLGLHDSGLKRDGAWSGGTPDGVGIVVSNAYGSLEAITELDRVAILETARYINPSRFPLTVSNSAAGYVSIWEDLRALNVTVSDGNCGPLDAVSCASLFIENGRAQALLVGGAEAMSEALALAFDRLGTRPPGACLGEGAALLVIESPEAARARGVRPLATIDGYGTAFVGPKPDAKLLSTSSEPAKRAIAMAFDDAGATAGEIDFVVSGLCGSGAFDDAELCAIRETAGDEVCILAPKLTLGESLGAGAAMSMLSAIALSGDRALTPDHPMVLRGRFRTQARTALVTSMGYYGNASALVMRLPSR